MLTSLFAGFWPEGKREGRHLLEMCKFCGISGHLEKEGLDLPFLLFCKELTDRRENAERSDLRTNQVMHATGLTSVRSEVKRNGKRISN